MPSSFRRASPERVLRAAALVGLLHEQRWTVQAIADELNKRRVPALNGAVWDAVAVRQVLATLKSR
jgi:hypothetical protein